MATGPGYPGSGNVYIPNWEASGRLAVGYSRNPKKFPLMNYLQLVESPRNTGYWLKFTTQEAARVVTTNDYRWGRGATRPVHPDGLESFNFISFSTQRFDYGFNLDDDTVDQAEWDVALQHSEIHAQKLMTARTIRALTQLTTAGNWQTTADPDMSSNHTATASSLAGGQIDQGSSTSPYLKKVLDKIAVQINLDTLGVVTPDMLQVVSNPNVARLVAESQEIHDYLKGSPAALDEIRNATSPNAMYGPGLPSSVYGYKWNVENCVKVTSRKGDTLTKAFAYPDQAINVVARVGQLEGVYGLPSFSTLTGFWYRDEMTIERFPDPKNRLMEYHLTEDMTEVLTSPLSGYYVTSATSVAS